MIHTLLRQLHALLLGRDLTVAVARNDAAAAGLDAAVKEMLRK